MPDFAALRQQLDTDGFCLVPNVLPVDLLARLRDFTDGLLSALSSEAQDQQRSTGSMIPVWDHPEMAELIALPGALDALRRLGWPEPKISGGYIISKPPGGPRLFWHYDYTGWNDPAAFDLPPAQIFLMWYLTDTCRENGCLRVIPGSHVNDNDLIPLLEEAHTDDLRRARGLDERVEFADRPDEIDVPVRAGSLLIGDSRLLHAAHANQTAQRRTVITLWYHPDLAALDERTVAMLAGLRRDRASDWPAAAREQVEPLLIRYEGTAEPFVRTRRRPYPRPGR